MIKPRPVPDPTRGPSEGGRGFQPGRWSVGPEEGLVAAWGWSSPWGRGLSGGDTSPSWEMSVVQELSDSETGVPLEPGRRRPSFGFAR